MITESDGIEELWLPAQTKLVNDAVYAGEESEEPADENISTQCDEDPSQYRRTGPEIDKAEDDDQSGDRHVDGHIPAIAQNMEIHIVPVLPVCQPALDAYLVHVKPLLFFCLK